MFQYSTKKRMFYHISTEADKVPVVAFSWNSNRMCIKGLPFPMWDVIQIHPMVLNKSENPLKRDDNCRQPVKLSLHYWFFFFFGGGG